MNKVQEMRDLSRSLVRLLGVFERDCGDTSLSPTQAHVLIELSHGSKDIGELANQLNIDISNAGRTVNSLLGEAYVTRKIDPNDKRRKVIGLSENGHQALSQINDYYNNHIQRCLEFLSDSELHQVRRGMSLYSKALSYEKNTDRYSIRPSEISDDSSIEQIIRKVSAKYGLSADEGYGVSDLSGARLSDGFQTPRSQYWVVESEGKILGGAGIAPLVGADDDICELQKMYFLDEARGLGLGRRLLSVCLKYAGEQKYRQCYLETTSPLKEATRLYETFGFRALEEPLGNTGHHHCEIRMVRDL